MPETVFASSVYEAGLDVLVYDIPLQVRTKFYLVAFLLAKEIYSLLILFLRLAGDSFLEPMFTISISCVPLSVL